MKASLPVRLCAATLSAAGLLIVAGCGDAIDRTNSGQGGAGAGFVTAGSGSVPLPPAPACAEAAVGSATVEAPVLRLSLADRWEEGWLASPAVADLDGDGQNEIVAARYGKIVVWSPDGALEWSYDPGLGRIWASPIVADFRDDARLEIVFSSRDAIVMLDAAGAVVPGFPVAWEDELRGIAAGDVDGDGQLDVVAVSTDGAGDIVNAWSASGAQKPGFPPIQAGTAGCGEKCFVAGCYDQNLAIGDLDGDAQQDIVAPHDNAYASIHRGSGEGFPANPMYPAPTAVGVRYLHDLAAAQQGWAEDEETALQAHFTNTPPAIADLDGDGANEVLLLASVQNASQNDRLKGVALWAVRPDASRAAGWETPFHVPGYLAGLWDLEGNIVGATNQVSVADLDPTRPGPELVFPGFDGAIHAVGADKTEIFQVPYTTDPLVLTGGVVIGDLSGDGIPEIVFNTYSQDEGKSGLFVLDAGGAILHEVALPRRGAMTVPTLADVDGDGTVEILVSLKDAEDHVESVQVYSVAGSSTNCLLWPTGRGNLLRNGWVRPGE